MKKKTKIKNIVLTGFMGAGKSSVARRLSEKLCIALICTDKLVEDKAGAAIKEIFATEGEARFRQLEKEVIARLASGRSGITPPIVLSTGG
ncbi:MAG: shikimate kinase, partial [Thermodesulfobacteriota bacterium]